MEAETEILRLAADILDRKGRQPLATLVRESITAPLSVLGSTPHERLRSLRRSSGFASARAAAEAHGWYHQTYAAHEGGVRPMPIQAIEKYAKAFGASPSAVLYGQ